MNSGDIHRKWDDRSLTRQDILAYLNRNVFTVRDDKPSDAEAHALAGMCYALYSWSIGEGSLGHFLTAVKNNDWAGICDHGDTLNSRYHWVYRMFLYNCAPGNWREMREEGEDNE